MNGLELFTAPAIEPITLTEVKEHLRIDSSNTSEDDYIDTLIEASTIYYQSKSWRQLITATYKQYLDNFPATKLELRKPPLQSVTSIKYQDTNGVEQTLSSSVYQVDSKSDVGRIVLADGESFPDTDEVVNAVTIEYKAGYGDAASDVPSLIKSSIKLIVAHLFENRDMVTKMGTPAQVPFPEAIDMLINQHSMRSFV